MIQRLNPETLFKSPAFSQVMIVEPSARFVFVGGQNAVNANGEIVGNDIASQTAQTIHNVVAALTAGGATLKDVIKMTIYVVQGHDLQAGYGAVAQYPELVTHPAAISVIVVAGLANPNYLVEIEALAAVQPEDSA